MFLYSIQTKLVEVLYPRKSPFLLSGLDRGPVRPTRHYGRTPVLVRLVTHVDVQSRTRLFRPPLLDPGSRLPPIFLTPPPSLLCPKGLSVSLVPTGVRDRTSLRPPLQCYPSVPYGVPGSPRSPLIKRSPPLWRIGNLTPYYPSSTPPRSCYHRWWVTVGLP